MSDLINITSNHIEGEAVQTVDARELHAFLEVGKDFSNWIKDRIDQYGFVENQDFVCSPILASNGRGGHNRIDYHVSLDMAKELAMVERNEKGKEARQYFIKCERLAKSTSRGVSVLRQVTPEFRAALSLAKAFGMRGNHAVLSANNTVRKLYGTDCAKLIGATHLLAETQEPLLTPTDLGARLDGQSAKAVNQLLADHGLQLAQRDLHGKLCWELTEAGKQHGVYLDTGKRHGDGTPVKQIKWLATVLGFLQPKAA